MWCFLALCGFVQMACQCFLVREACVGVLLGGAVFLLSPFEDLGCFSGCLMSSAGIQKLFCGIYSVFKWSFDEFVGEKVFSTVRVTQRGSQHYMEKRRGRRELEVTQMR